VNKITSQVVNYVSLESVKFSDIENFTPEFIHGAMIILTDYRSVKFAMILSKIRDMIITLCN
jgi:hypothetical protein